MSLADRIDDPHGFAGREDVLPEDRLDDATDYFVERVQAIRWELHDLILMVDHYSALTRPTERATFTAIDLLGIAARAEAAMIDGVDPDPVGLFLDRRERKQATE